MSDLIQANDVNFPNLLNDSRTIIVDFWSPTCVPCSQIEPGLKKIAQSYSAQVKVLKVNVDESPKTSSRFFVRGLPTLLFIKDGNVKTQLIGTANSLQIEQKLREVI